MTEPAGRGPLTGARVEALARALAALPGATLAPRVRARAYPGGPADGFDAGSEPDREFPLDPAAPVCPGLGEDLLSAELEVRGPGWAAAVALVATRDAAGPGWRAELDVYEGAAPPALAEALAALGEIP